VGDGSRLFGGGLTQTWRWLNACRSTVAEMTRTVGNHADHAPLLKNP
jgi:hypothetical protein